MCDIDDFEAVLSRMVSKGQLAGATTRIWRDGSLVQSASLGWRNVEAGLPIERDTIFRIASLSKPVTSVVALTILEEGRFALDEPISRWAPEFANMRVMRDPEGPLDETDPAAKPINFDDLLTHRAGLTCGDFHKGPLGRAYPDALGGAIDTDVTPDEWIARLAALPLIDQPGEAFHYSYATDLLGLLLARMEKAPLFEVMRRRLFAPLEMRDTSFTVPIENRGRRAKMYGFDDDGRLVERKRSPGGAFIEERPENMSFQSGGQGLWSTVDDYLTFARLFIEGGTVDGVPVLKPETVALMTTNRLSESQRTSARLLGMPVFTGLGFGLGVAVVMDPEKAPAIRSKGAIGTVGWPGAYGGWWQADPINKSVMVFLAHNALDLQQMAKGIGLDVYTAISEFHTLGSQLNHEHA